ncbi:hypothetical protein D7D52_14415 [Nocardia yunnanensis]|uniref:Uncharacterized protein n=1 Tax=Nocardia yunnanensis TaxID=2382165 RepID=A0A386ZB10_9NOCA|nr:hypothetical protein D7D52_14415 [Nocardia yunnanensis]
MKLAGNPTMNGPMKIGPTETLTRPCVVVVGTVAVRLRPATIRTTSAVIIRTTSAARMVSLALAAIVGGEGVGAGGMEMRRRGVLGRMVSRMSFRRGIARGVGAPGGGVRGHRRRRGSPGR